MQEIIEEMVDSERTSCDLFCNLAGLKIISNAEISQITRSEYTDAVVNISFHKEDTSNPSHVEDWLVSTQPDELPTFINQNGTEIVVTEHIDKVYDRALEVRRVLPYASYLQRKPMLHASSALFNDGVTAFIGESGSGKSTFAQKLSELSYELISDDLLPVREIESNFVVPFQKNMIPLKALVFLSRDKLTEEVRISKLTKSKALELLIHNSFGDLVSEKIWVFQFEFFLKLVRETVCLKLEIPDNLKKLRQSVSDFINKFESLKQFQPKADS